MGISSRFPLADRTSSHTAESLLCVKAHDTGPWEIEVRSKSSSLDSQPTQRSTPCLSENTLQTSAQLSHIFFFGSSWSTSLFQCELKAWIRQIRQCQPKLSSWDTSHLLVALMSHC